MNPLVAVVSVKEQRGTGVCVRFEFPTTGQTVDFPMPDRRPLEAMRHKAGVYLEQVVRQAGNLRMSWDEATGILATLLNKGWSLARVLAPDHPRRLLELGDAFRRAWPARSLDDWLDVRSPLPLVELISFPETIPIELLPVFDITDVPPLRTYDDLAQAASRFLGFSAVVKRFTPASLTSDRVLRNHPALPVQFIRHRGLSSAASEERVLSSMGGFVRVDGPWPTDQSEDEVLEELVAALFDGAGFDGGDPTGPPAQIHHFACHCDTTAELDDDYELVMSTQSGRQRRVTIAQLEEAHRKRLDHTRRERSVILMNACGSSKTNPLTAFSFPRLFLSCGHRAFIGTEARVPDEVAYGFATSFYGRLLERRRPIGEAVVAARRDLLRDFRNPLGLLYVIYGDTDLAVQHARPGVYRATA